MLHLLSAHDGRQVELLQVLSQELVHCGDISVLHWPQARSLGSLQKAGQMVCVAGTVAFITQGLPDKRHGDALCSDQSIFSPTTQHSPSQPRLPGVRMDAIGRDADGKEPQRSTAGPKAPRARSSHAGSGLLPANDTRYLLPSRSLLPRAVGTGWETCPGHREEPLDVISSWTRFLI